MPACVRGYANRRPGIFHTFSFNLYAISSGLGSQMLSSFVSLVVRLDTFLVQVLLFGQSLCQHASGVMPIGARGFSTHFLSICMQSHPVWGHKWCQVLSIRGYVWCKRCISFRIECASAFVGPKYVPACVRGYANRRPGIFYTF